MCGIARSAAAVVILALVATVAVAECNAPKAADIYSTILDLWHAERFEDLDSYVDTLSPKFENYVPAMLARSFREYIYRIYRGNLPVARDTLSTIQGYVAQREDLDEFRGRLALAIQNLNEIIMEINSDGQDFPVPSSPSVMKEAFDDLYPPTVVPRSAPPIIEFLKLAPEEFIGDTGVGPVATIVSPSDGASLSSGGDVPIQANVSGASVPVCKVEAIVDGGVIGSSTEAPYVILWQSPSVGEHGLVARVTDYMRRVSESQLATVTVQ